MRNVSSTAIIYLWSVWYLISPLWKVTLKLISMDINITNYHYYEFHNNWIPCIWWKLTHVAASKPISPDYMMKEKSLFLCVKLLWKFVGPRPLKSRAAESRSETRTQTDSSASCSWKFNHKFHNNWYKKKNISFPIYYRN